MSAHVRLDGFDALIRELTDAPEDIKAEAMEYIREETEGAAIELASSFGTLTGRTRAAVKTSYPSSTILVGIAQATSPASHLQMWGTKDRRNRSGANRGRMPAIDASRNIVAIANRRRVRLFQRIKELLTRKGFEVSE